MNKSNTYKAFFYLCFIFISNFILKPVRDQLVVEYLLEEIEWLFSFSFLVTLLLVPVISVALNKVRLLNLIKFIHVLYGLFLIVISQYLAAGNVQSSIIIFFIISSNFFNLLFISLFWNLLTDIFKKDEAIKSFVFIASGATIGSLIGPVLLLLFTDLLTISSYLVLIGVINLGLPALLSLQQTRINHHFSIPKTDKRYIGNLSGSIIIYTTISSFLYIIIASEIRKYQLSTSQIIYVFAIRDLLINTLTLAIQLVIAREWIKVKFPYGFMSIPVLTLLLFGSALLFPSIYFLIGFQIIQKSGSRGLIKPSNEVLFSDYYHKYKRGIKNFLDMVLYRIGDMLGAWLFILVGYLGSPNVSIAIIGGFLSVCWLFYNYKIGQTKNTYHHVDEKKIY